MNAIDTIRQWCSGKGYAFSYGNPTHVNWWMGNTDFSASTNGTAVFCHLLTASEYDGSKDSYNVGIYFATLCDFDFDNESIDTTTEALKERAKALLQALAQGNAVSWSGARFTYGYDDYAENVVWCCLRVTLTALAAECVEMPAPFTLSVPYMVEGFGGLDTTTHDDIVSGTISSIIIFSAAVLTQYDFSSKGATMTCNGTSLNVDVDTLVVDENTVNNYPELEGYEGYYVTMITSTDAYTYQSGTYEVTVTLGDVWTATATWEEE